MMKPVYGSRTLTIVRLSVLAALGALALVFPQAEGTRGNLRGGALSLEVMIRLACRFAPVFAFAIAAPGCAARPPPAPVATAQAPSVPAAAAAARAPEAGDAGAETEPTICQSGTAPYEAAEAALSAISARMERMRGPREVEDVAQALERLLGTPCFARLGTWRSLETTSALALSTWWKTGGETWVRSTLRLAEDHPPLIVVPPDMRTSVAFEDHGHDTPPHPLAPLICPPDEKACGSATRAWRLRSEQVFARTARDDAPECPLGKGYAEWRACLEEHRPVVPALPLGDLREPRRGWLVLRRPSWTSANCSAVDAYDLESGSAYRRERCPEGESARAGVVRADALREATWMILLAKYVEEKQIAAIASALPAGMRVEAIGSAATGHGRGTTDASTLTWSWRVRERTLAEGAFRIAEEEPGTVYAADLVAVMDAGFEERRPPMALPAWVRMGD